jgi:hypothetical protein
MEYLGIIPILPLTESRQFLILNDTRERIIGRRGLVSYAMMRTPMDRILPRCSPNLGNNARGGGQNRGPSRS